MGEGQPGLEPPAARRRRGGERANVRASATATASVVLLKESEYNRSGLYSLLTNRMAIS